MTVLYHDHPESPDTIHPGDLDLYALDALPPGEAEAVENALVAAGPEQSRSMLAHIRSSRELAADLVADADLDVAPPPALRDRVLELAAAEKARTSPATDAPAGGAAADDGDAEQDRSGGGTVLDLSSARARRRPGPMTFLAAAAAVALLAAGVGIGRLTDGTDPQQNLPVAAPPATSMPDRVTSLLAAEDLEIARGPVGSTGNATVLASRAADMAVISMTDLPEPAEGRAYQLWLMGDHDPIPAGTMESGQVGLAPSAQINGIRDSEQIGLTDEPAGGSPAPTGEVLLALDLT